MIRRAAKRVGQALGVLLLSLLVAEVVLRVLDLPPPSLPRLPVDPQNVPLNPLGLREPWSEVPARQPGELRVVVLGDSFVFGEGVADHETLPARLEALLAARLPERRVRVFNLGFRGADLAEESRRYAPLHDRLDPDLLLLVLYLNDLSPEMPADMLARLYGARERAGFLARHSWVVGHVWSRVRRAALGQEIIRHYRDTTVAALPAAFPAIGRQIVDLRHFVETDGVAFGMALYPWLVALDDYPLGAVHDRVRRFAEERGITFVDLLPAFRGESGESCRVAPADEHPNAAAHARAAAALAAALLPGLRSVSRDR